MLFRSSLSVSLSLPVSLSISLSLSLFQSLSISLSISLRLILYPSIFFFTKTFLLHAESFSFVIHQFLLFFLLLSHYSFQLSFPSFPSSFCISLLILFPLLFLPSISHLTLYTPSNLSSLASFFLSFIIFIVIFFPDLFPDSSTSSFSYHFSSFSLLFLCLYPLLFLFLFISHFPLPIPFYPIRPVPSHSIPFVPSRPIRPVPSHSIPSCPHFVPFPPRPIPFYTAQHTRVQLPSSLDSLLSNGRWGVCGFPAGNHDPLKDFHTQGFLALKCLTEFFKRYQEEGSQLGVEFAQKRARHCTLPQVIIYDFLTGRKIIFLFFDEILLIIY